MHLSDINLKKKEKRNRTIVWQKRLLTWEISIIDLLYWKRVWQTDSKISQENLCIIDKSLKIAPTYN